MNQVEKGNDAGDGLALRSFTLAAGAQCDWPARQSSGSGQERAARAWKERTGPGRSGQSSQSRGKERWMDGPPRQQLVRPSSPLFFFLSVNPGTNTCSQHLFRFCKDARLSAILLLLFYFLFLVPDECYFELQLQLHSGKSTSPQHQDTAHQEIIISRHYYYYHFLTYSPTRQSTPAQSCMVPSYQTRACGAFWLIACWHFAPRTLSRLMRLPLLQPPPSPSPP